jgi:hypothetical protein
MSKPFMAGCRAKVIFVFCSPTMEGMGRWCTVTVTDDKGQRHSLDTQAESSYDAAHLYVTHAKAQPQAGLPVPTLATVFEVVNGGKVYTIQGTALQRWVEQRRQEWKGPRGLLFSRRPTLLS